MPTITRPTRDLLVARSGGACELCAAPSADPHHRQLKGMGGGGDDTVANLLAVCRPCHDEIHRTPGRSTRFGWIVSRWANPVETPVRLFGSGWVLLTSEGGYKRWEVAA